jgi:putative DNA primase/helicase
MKTPLEAVTSTRRGISKELSVLWILPSIAGAVRLTRAVAPGAMASEFSREEIVMTINLDSHNREKFAAAIRIRGTDIEGGDLIADGVFHNFKDTSYQIFENEEGKTALSFQNIVDGRGFSKVFADPPRAKSAQTVSPSNAPGNGLRNEALSKSAPKGKETVAPGVISSQTRGIQGRKGKEDFEGRVRFIKASQVPKSPMHWLLSDVLPEFLPCDMFTVLAGEPAKGKTTLMLTIAALLSREGKNSIIWSGEDSKAKVMVPDLELARADMDRIYFPDGVEKYDPNGQMIRHAFNPQTDFEKLKFAVNEVGEISLIVICPLTLAFKGHLNDYGDVRASYEPLIQLAEDLHCAIVGITHLRKGSQGEKISERVNGSIAIVAGARMVWAVTGSSDKNRYALTRAKSNVSDEGGGRVFSLHKTVIKESDEIYKPQCVEFGETLEGSADDVFDEFEEKRGYMKLSEEKKYLNARLSRGAVTASVILSEAKMLGLSERSLRTAKKELRIISTKKGKDSTWALPSEKDSQSFIPAKTEEFAGMKDEEMDAPGITAKNCLNAKICRDSRDETLDKFIPAKTEKFAGMKDEGRDEQPDMPPAPPFEGGGGGGDDDDPYGSEEI